MSALSRPPNIILINCDDLGYGDIGCYGSTCNRTPHLDQMAAEGLRLTDFYMPSAVCSPSRAGMLTGCYPNRIGFDEFHGLGVLFPGFAEGLHPEEVTIARALRDRGYGTALVGKWHCGDQPPFLPTRHGFDQYFGLPYSNDMGRQAVNRQNWMRSLHQRAGTNYGLGDDGDVDYPPLPLMDGEKVLQEQPDQRALTERYVGECLRFMRGQTAQAKPFFLYFAQMYVHLPIYVPEPWASRSQNGPYGAAVEHVDWSVGVLLNELKRLGIDDNTLVIFTSDNGSRAQGEGGHNTPLRGTKATTWEGGLRVPCLLRWPGTIPAGTVGEGITTAMDFLPTFLRFAGEGPDLPHPIDGVDMTGTWVKGEPSPRDTFAYFHLGQLEAVRKGPWKRFFRRSGEVVQELYYLRDDVGEQTNRFAGEPEVVAELDQLAEIFRTELGDLATGQKGRGCRPVGKVDQPVPLTTYSPDHPYFAAEYDIGNAG